MIEQFNKCIWVEEITLNRNVTVIYFLEIFIYFFHTSLGTLLPEQGLPLKLVCFVGFAQE
jgi:hypothetical protein